jgi:transcription factor IIIB subunit 2
MTILCQNCGSLDIETNTAEGNAFCLNCGTVLEENAIVSEVTFAETSNGASVLQGQFVSAEKGFRPMGASSLSGRRMNPNESREITIASG